MGWSALSVLPTICPESRLPLATGPDRTFVWSYRGIYVDVKLSNAMRIDQSFATGLQWAVLDARYLTTEAHSRPFTAHAPAELTSRYIVHLCDEVTPQAGVTAAKRLLVFFKCCFELLMEAARVDNDSGTGG